MKTIKTENKPTHTPGPQPIGDNWGNGLPAQRCAKCKTLCAPEIVNPTLGWCEMCLAPVRAAAPELLAALKKINLNDLTREAESMVHAAIAKAEGR